MRLRLRRRQQPDLDPQLVLDVAEVYPHDEGRDLWWESYQRRSPALRAELVADLRRRLERNRAAGL